MKILAFPLRLLRVIRLSAEHPLDEQCAKYKESGVD